VNQVANPGLDKATSMEHILYEEEILSKIEDIAQKAGKIQDWTPYEHDVEIIVDCLADAYRARTSAGMDEITPDMIIFAHTLMGQALLRILNIIAAAAKTPTAWGED
jgi:hypothetical protein